MTSVEIYFPSLREPLAVDAAHFSTVINSFSEKFIRSLSRVIQNLKTGLLFNF